MKLKSRKIILSFILLISFVTLLQAQWTEQTSGVTTSLYTISAVTDNIAWICGSFGRVLRTTNGGTTWTLTANPTSAVLYNIFGVDDNTALTTSSPSSTFVYRTTNGGTTWAQVFTQAGGYIDAIWMTSATNGFMMGDPVGGRWSLWKTTNGGANWDSAGLYLAQNTSEIGWYNGMMILGNNIWFISSSARVYYSSNNGTSWNPQTIGGVSTYWGGIWFNDVLNGILFYDNFFNRTTNSGTNWVTATIPGSADGCGITGTGNFWFIVRESRDIYKSTNNGVTWTTDYTAPAGNYWHIQKAITGNRMWAIRSNGGISKSDFLMGVYSISVEIPSTYSLEQNYPNPFNPTTTIRFAITSNLKAGVKSETSNVKLIIYDALGREIETLVNESIKPGTYEVKFDASKYSSGVYFYKLIISDASAPLSTSFTETRKMLLVK